LKKSIKPGGGGIGSGKEGKAVIIQRCIGQEGEVAMDMKHTSGDQPTLSQKETKTKDHRGDREATNGSRGEEKQCDAGRQQREGKGGGGKGHKIKHGWGVGNTALTPKIETGRKGGGGAKVGDLRIQGLENVGYNKKWGHIWSHERVASSDHTKSFGRSERKSARREVERKVKGYEGIEMLEEKGGYVEGGKVPFGEREPRKGDCRKAKKAWRCQ